MHIHIIQHEAFETLVYIGDWIETNQVKCRNTNRKKNRHTRKEHQYKETF
jgi:hypothetical protein